MSGPVKKKSRGLKATEAELLVATWLETMGWTCHRAAPALFWAGGVPRSRSHDLFGALDVLAIQRDHMTGSGGIGDPILLREVWAVQVTTQAGRSKRRSKLGAVAWPRGWRVSLVSHEVTEDPTNRSKRVHWLKIEDLDFCSWQPPKVVGIDPKVIKKFRRDRRAAGKPSPLPGEDDEGRTTYAEDPLGGSLT